MCFTFSVFILFINVHQFIEIDHGISPIYISLVHQPLQILSLLNIYKEPQILKKVLISPLSLFSVLLGQ